MTYEEWEKKFKPIDIDNDMGTYLVDLYDPLLSSADSNRIWTLIDGEEDDNCYIVNGVRTVNRIAFIVTEQPFEEDEYIEILDD